MGLMAFASTLREAARLGRIGLAARAAAQGESDTVQSRARLALVQMLSDVRGIPLKVGQLLGSLQPDTEFQQLTHSVEPLPLKLIFPQVERELGRPWRSVFASIEPAAAAASLGQVHRALLLDGTEVALKVQYPDIEQAVESQLRLANLVPGVGPVRTWGFDLDSYKRVLKQNMDRELDYLSEAERQQRFAQGVRVPGLLVPKVYPELCTRRLLVQQWVCGARLDAISFWSEHDKAEVARILLSSLFASVFVHGQVHGDPHLGNYLVHKASDGTPQLIQLDFGCTVPVPEAARLALLKLILGCRETDDTQPLACFAAMGFDPVKLAPIESRLPALCQLLFAPLLSEMPFPLQHWHLGQRTGELLGDLKWWFRSAGPASLLLLMRAFAGVTSHLQMLGKPLAWWPILLETAGSVIDQARAYHPPPVAGCEAHFHGMARKLCVRVCEDGRQVVSVSMPAVQTARLAEMVPEETLAKLEHARIDVTTIAQNACAAGLKPQLLFECDIGPKSYKVWLE